MSNEVYLSLVNIPLAIVTNGNHADDGGVFYLVSNAVALQISSEFDRTDNLLCFSSRNVNESSDELQNRIHNKFSDVKVQIMSWRISCIKQHLLYPVNNNFISEFISFLEKECYILYTSQDDFLDIESLVYRSTYETDLVIDNTQTNLTNQEIQNLLNNDCSFGLISTASYIEFLKGQCRYDELVIT